MLFRSSDSKVLSLLTEHKTYPIDKIYLGKISNIVSSLNAAFIQLNKKSKKNGFIDLNDLKKESKLDESNTEVYKNKNFLIQIKREPVGNKGPTVSTRVNLNGKYLTLYPFSQEKKKFQLENKKEYIEALNYLLKPNYMSLSLKKESINVNKDFLLKEVNNLKNKWIQIVKNSKNSLIPSTLKKKTS